MEHGVIEYLFVALLRSVEFHYSLLTSHTLNTFHMYEKENGSSLDFYQIDIVLIWYSHIFSI